MLAPFRHPFALFCVKRLVEFHAHQHVVQRLPHHKPIVLDARKLEQVIDVLLNLSVLHFLPDMTGTSPMSCSRLECEKKNQRVKTRPTDYCFVYLRIRGAVPSNDDDTSHINSLTLVHLSSWVRPLWRVVRITATEHFTLLYFDCFCRWFYISFLHRITSFLPL